MKHCILSGLIIIMLTGIPAHSLKAESDVISEQKAISIAQQNQPGRVLSITLTKTKTKSGSAYRVKILSAGGNVHIILIDAQSGSLISSQ